MKTILKKHHFVCKIGKTTSNNDKETFHTYLILAVANLVAQRHLALPSLPPPFSPQPLSTGYATLTLTLF